MVNEVTLLGNLGTDPEKRVTDTGMHICKFSVATHRKDKDGGDETEWHRVVTFGKTAENCAKYLSKGRTVFVKGRIKTDQYEKNGEKCYATNIIADRVQFVNAAGGQAEKKESKSNQESFEEIPF